MDLNIQRCYICDIKPEKNTDHSRHLEDCHPIPNDTELQQNVINVQVNNTKEEILNPKSLEVNLSFNSLVKYFKYYFIGSQELAKKGKLNKLMHALK